MRVCGEGGEEGVRVGMWHSAKVNTRIMKRVWHQWESFLYVCAGYIIKSPLNQASPLNRASPLNKKASPLNKKASPLNRASPLRTPKEILQCQQECKWRTLMPSM